MDWKQAVFVGIQGLVSLAIVGGTLYLIYTGQPVPELLGVAFGGVVGFFLGTRDTVQGAIKQ